MNLESFYIRTDNQTSIIQAVKIRLASEAEEAGSQGSAPLPSSYDPLLRTDEKRKLAVSPAQRGWIYVVEAKEVVDFELARVLSTQEQTDVIVIQLSESVGARGTAVFKSGELLSADYSDDDNDPSGTVWRFLSQYGVPERLIMFREAIKCREQGWAVITR